MGGMSSVAQCSSWLVLGSVVYYPALTGEEGLLGGPISIAPPFNFDFYYVPGQADS